MFFYFFNEWFQLGNLTISVSNPTLTWVWKHKAELRVYVQVILVIFFLLLFI